MNRSTSTLFVLALIFLLLCLVSSIPAAVSQGLPKGQIIYEARCAACHGLKAKGVYSMAKTLKVDPSSLDLTRPALVHRTSQSLQNSVANGHYKMPKHRETLTPQQIQAVVKYLRSLQTTVALKTQ